MNGTGEAVDRIICNAHSVFFVLIRNHRENWSEDLFLSNRVIGRDVGKHRWLDEVPPHKALRNSTAQYQSAVTLRHLDVVEDAVSVSGGDLGTLPALRIPRVSNVYGTKARPSELHALCVAR